MSEDYDNSGSNCKLLNEWYIWYHHEKNNWKIDGYKKIYEINNIKDFWDFNNNINDLGGINSQHFFMMKKNVHPIWEDENNKSGGCWSIKIPVIKSFDLWLKLSMYIIGETLIDDEYLINGLSICAKNSNTAVIKIWNNDSSKHSLKLLPQEIINEYGFNIIYKSHIPEY